jgi:DNA-directed RNA polymerase specialized sigma24 family protein
VAKQLTERELLEDAVRLLALQVRYQFPSQAEATVALRKLGFAPTRIAELLGTTPGTVQKDLQPGANSK